MSRRTVGVSLIAISAFLYASRLLAAAIWGSGLGSLSADLFRNLLSYVGSQPIFLSLLALLAGLAYLLWAELGARREP